MKTLLLELVEPPYHHWTQEVLWWALMPENISETAKRLDREYVKLVPILLKLALLVLKKCIMRSAIFMQMPE